MSSSFNCELSLTARQLVFALNNRELSPRVPTLRQYVTTPTLLALLYHCFCKIQVPCCWQQKLLFSLRTLVAVVVIVTVVYVVMHAIPILVPVCSLSCCWFELKLIPKVQRGWLSAKYIDLPLTSDFFLRSLSLKSEF